MPRPEGPVNCGWARFWPTGHSCRRAGSGPAVARLREKRNRLAGSWIGSENADATKVYKAAEKGSVSVWISNEYTISRGSVSV